MAYSSFYKTVSLETILEQKNAKYFMTKNNVDLDKGATLDTVKKTNNLKYLLRICLY